MRIPNNIIANADDLGYSASVNSAILHCFEHEYINSTSLMTNMEGFEEAATLIHERPAIKNIGIHIDLAEGKPLTNLKGNYFDSEGNWDVYKTNRVSNRLDTAAKAAFLNEINAQISRALSEKIPVSHLDSHLHLHTLPCFYKLFLVAAKQHNLKLRLAQTYKEGSYLKYYYRKYINNQFRKNGLNYSDRFETIEKFLKDHNNHDPKLTIEIMLHPWFNQTGELTDHYDPLTLQSWVSFIKINN
ncbi:MAG: ChbG/HpnK family deacetylase [Mucilaginibacter sp.]